MSRLLSSLRRAVATRAVASASEIAGLLVVGTVALALLGLLWWQQRPAGSLPAPVAHESASTEASATPAAVSSPGLLGPTPLPTAAPLVVHVAGAVREPGVYTLAAGARVVDAVDAAGGLRPDADEAAVNLAQPLIDGAQVRVPEPGEAPLAGTGVLPAAPSSGGASSTSAPIDLNAADATALEGIPGVGPVTAERIVAHRQEVGGFRSVDDLLDVRGIGEARLAEISEHVVVR